MNSLAILDFNGVIDVTPLKLIYKVLSEYDISIASRNDEYYLRETLSMLEISNLFGVVMADFRPKSYQIKHILSIYKNNGIVFDEIIFVDDDERNISEVKQHLPKVKCFRFGKDIQSLGELV